MNRSLTNITVIVLIIIVSVAPVFGFFTRTFFHKPPYPFYNYLSIIAVFLILFERGNLIFPKYVIFYGLFTLYTILSDIFIVNLSFGNEFIRNNRLIGSFLFCLIFENIQIQYFLYEKLLKIFLITIIVTFIVIVIQEIFDSNFLVPPGFNSGIGENKDRLVSIFSWSEDRMAFGLCFLPILTIVTEMALRNKNKVFILFYFMGLIISFLNRSRITLIQFSLIFLLLPIYQGLKINITIKYIGLFGLFLIILFFVLKSVNVDVIQIVNERILEKSKGGIIQGSGGTRILAFKIFAETFPKSPVFGKGKFFRKSGTDDIELHRLLGGRSYQIHVGYLSLLYYYGIVGGLFYLAFLITLTAKFYKDAKHTLFWAPFIGWLMYIFNNLTDVYLFFDFMGILLIIVINNYYVQNKNNEKHAYN